jgi:pyruvate formate lyase activating enzyme
MAPLYARAGALQLDPIEKKPLARFHPGSQILSIGSFGCNLDCAFCQNHSLSRGGSKWAQAAMNGDPDTPQEIKPIKLALTAKATGTLGVAFTYNEPLTWYEYVFDTAKFIKEKFSEQKTVLVTNGFINEEPFKALLPYIDAANIDLKGDDLFYTGSCGCWTASLAKATDPVKRSIALALEAGVHVEVTFLAIDTLNTSDECVNDVVDFLAGLDPEIPLHVSRYFPRYRLTLPATTYETLVRIVDIARKKLKYVYMGNV